MALGAVATGNMKAIEHDKDVAYNMYSGFTSRLMAWRGRILLRMMIVLVM